MPFKTAKSALVLFCILPIAHISLVSARSGECNHYTVLLNLIPLTSLANKRRRASSAPTAILLMAPTALALAQTVFFRSPEPSQPQGYHEFTRSMFGIIGNAFGEDFAHMEIGDFLTGNSVCVSNGDSGYGVWNVEALCVVACIGTDCAGLAAGEPILGCSSRKTNGDLEGCGTLKMTTEEIASFFSNNPAESAAGT